MDFAFDPFNTHRLAVGEFLYLHHTYTHSHTHTHTHTHTYAHTLSHSHTCVACDDAKIRVWTIPECGLTKTLTEPDFYLIGELVGDVCVGVCDVIVYTGHHEKPNVLAFHPQARDLLMSAGYDGKIFLWDLSNRCVALEMKPLSQPVCPQAASACSFVAHTV